MPPSVLKCTNCRRRGRKCSLTPGPGEGATAQDFIAGPCDSCSRHGKRCEGATRQVARQILGSRARSLRSSSLNDDVRGRQEAMAQSGSVTQEIRATINQILTDVDTSKAALSYLEQARTEHRNRENTGAQHQLEKLIKEVYESILAPQLQGLCDYAGRALEAELPEVAERAYSSILETSLDVESPETYSKEVFETSRRALGDICQASNRPYKQMRSLQSGWPPFDQGSLHSPPSSVPAFEVARLEACKRRSVAVKALIEKSTWRRGRNETFWPLNVSSGDPVGHIALRSGFLSTIPVDIMSDSDSFRAVNINGSTILHSAIAMPDRNVDVQYIINNMPLESFLMADLYNDRPLQLAFHIGNEYAVTAILPRFKKEPAAICQEYTTAGWERETNVLGAMMKYALRHRFKPETLILIEKQFEYFSAIPNKESSREGSIDQVAREPEASGAQHEGMLNSPIMRATVASVSPSVPGRSEIGLYGPPSGDLSSNPTWEAFFPQQAQFGWHFSSLDAQMDISESNAPRMDDHGSQLHSQLDMMGAAYTTTNEGSSNPQPGDESGFVKVNFDEPS